MEFQYTIIIPHYNIPHLLRRCLWSIPRRDDTQVIVVDDKSSEENVMKLRELEREFSNVKFIYSNVNGGGGKARNIGLQHAKGKYVLFADADDFFNYCINDVLDRYSCETYDIVFFNATYIDSETYLSTGRNPTINIYMCHYEKNHNPDELKYMFGEPWCKLIRRDLVEKNNVRFDETPIHNDTTFSYLVGYHSSSVKVDNVGLYCLADRRKSVSKAMSSQNLLVRANVFSKKNRFLREHNIHFFDSFMVTPFDIFLSRRDVKNLKEYLGIVAAHGFSKSNVWWLFIKYKLDRALSKTKFIVQIFL